MKVEFLRLAQTELDDAFAYYELQQVGLGFKFQQTVSDSLSRIVNYPTAYQKVGKYSRRCVLHKFPYGVIYQYRETQQAILVVAIAHLHRQPDYWLSREH